MTYQPPQPPPGSPPPPPPGQWGPPPGGGTPAFDPKNVNPLDWAAVGAGVLAFIFSFVSFYTLDVGVSGGCPAIYKNAASNYDAPSFSAWHGFFGWFGVLLALVGAGLIAVNTVAPQVKLPVPTRLAALGAFAIAALCEILAIFVTPGSSYSGGLGGLGGSCSLSVDVGHGFGFWITLILVLAGTVVTLMTFQQSGGQLPGALNKVPNIGGYGPQGNLGGSTTPPAQQQPPAGYQQPPAQQQYGTPPPPPPPPPGYGQPPQQ